MTDADDEQGYEEYQEQDYTYDTDSESEQEGYDETEEQEESYETEEDYSQDFDLTMPVPEEMPENFFSDEAYHTPHFKKIYPQRYDFYKSYLGKQTAFTIELPHIHFSITHPQHILFNHYYPVHSPWCLTLVVNHAPYVKMLVPQNLLNVMVFPTTNPLQITELSEDVVANLIEILLAPYLQNIENQFGFHVRFELIRESEPLTPYFTQILFTDNRNMYYPVMVFGEHDYVRDFMDKFYMQAEQPACLQPTIHLSLVSHIKYMSYRRLKQIKNGEIIILMTDRHLMTQPIAIIENRLAFYADIDDQSLQITSEIYMLPHIKEMIMNQEESDHYPDSQHTGNPYAELSDMRVPVSFELSKIDLPVHYLSQISQGQVLDLGKPIDENVSVVVNNKVIALGEIVQVGRNFGVIIKEVLS